MNDCKHPHLILQEGPIHPSGREYRCELCSDHFLVSKLTVEVEYGSDYAFDDALRSAINRNSRENGSDTPDFILSEYLRNCLKAFDGAAKRREQWYGRGKVVLERDPVIRAMDRGCAIDNDPAVSAHTLASEAAAPDVPDESELREAIELGIESARALRGEVGAVVDAKRILTVNILSCVQAVLRHKNRTASPSGQPAPRKNEQDECCPRCGAPWSEHHGDKKAGGYVCPKKTHGDALAALKAEVRREVIEECADELERPYPESVFTALSDEQVDAIVSSMDDTVPSASSRMHASWARHWAKLLREKLVAPPAVTRDGENDIPTKKRLSSNGESAGSE